ncbi:MAG TPA: acyl-CoA dehydrogenase family protein [Actinomycetota bacterium]|jgi:alkylation response protein AidB-like acyl-CoA dehydrogenase
MDFAFTEEQEMLRSQARSFLEEKFPADRIAEIATTDDVGGQDMAWRELAELGWIGLSVAESDGGAGMSFLEEAVLFEETGRALYPGPYFSTIGLCLPLLSGDLLGAVLSGERAATLAWAEPSSPYGLAHVDQLSTKAEPSNGGWAITGEKHLVPLGAHGGAVLVVAVASEGAGVWAVELDSDGVSGTELSTMDGTRRLGRLQLTGAPASVVVAPGEGEAALESVRLRALAALALEAVGIATKAHELSMEHVKTRKQFDKPIGSYQAVSHQVADTYVETELARSLAYWAAWCVANDPDQAPVAVAAAKAAASEAAVAACERAIQVHGGIGFTWEHPLHLYYKRAQWIDSFEGFGSVHRATVAVSLLD